jgi:hypothetical protein
VARATTGLAAGSGGGFQQEPVGKMVALCVEAQVFGETPFTQASRIPRACCGPAPMSDEAPRYVGCTNGPRWASSSRLPEASHISAGQN